MDLQNLGACYDRHVYFDPDTSIFHFVGTVAEKNVSEKEVLVSRLRYIHCW